MMTRDAKPMTHDRLEKLMGAKGLTASERIVAELAADGKSNQEIASAAGIALGTVKVHMSRVLQKLGCHRFDLIFVVQKIREGESVKVLSLAISRWIMDNEGRVPAESMEGMRHILRAALEKVGIDGDGLPV